MRTFHHHPSIAPPRSVAEILAEGPGRGRLEELADAILLRGTKSPLLHDPEQYPVLIRALDQLVTQGAGQLLLPNLNELTKTLAVFSDYCGATPDSPCDVYSFLVVSYDALEAHGEELQRVRAQHNLAVPYRRVEYKKLHDKVTRRAVGAWLEAFNLLPGLLFTIAIDKSFGTVMTDNLAHSAATVADEIKRLGFAAYRPHAAERVCRVVHLVSYWLALLSQAEHGAFWMTDDDDMVANPGLTESTRHIWAQVLTMYRPKPFAPLGFATPFKEPRQRAIDFEDLVGMADLAAGALDIDLASQAPRTKTKRPPASPSALHVRQWLDVQGLGLKKLRVLAMREADGSMNMKLAQPFGAPGYAPAAQPIYLHV